MLTRTPFDAQRLYIARATLSAAINILRSGRTGSVASTTNLNESKSHLPLGLACTKTVNPGAGDECG